MGNRYPSQRRQWHPTPVLLPGKSHGWRSLEGCMQSVGSLRVRHNWTSSLSFFTFMHWRRKWHPTPVLLPGESQGRGSLVGGRLWGRTESDTTEATWQQEVCCCKTVLFGLYCKPKSNADVAHWLARLYWSAFWTQTFSKTWYHWDNKEQNVTMFCWWNKEV